MTATTGTSRSRTTALSCLLLGSGLVFGLLVSGFSPASATFAQSDAHRPSRELDTDHARRTAELKKTMHGPVDVFFDVTEVTASEPSLKGVRFSGLVDVTGKELLLFSKTSAEEWLIDPDMVLTFRITKEAKRQKR